MLTTFCDFTDKKALWSLQMIQKIDTSNKWLRAAAGLFSAIVLIVVTAQMGVFALLGVIIVAAIAAYIGRESIAKGSRPQETSDDLLAMRVQSLEIQLADEKAMVAALTNDFEPSDF